MDDVRVLELRQYTLHPGRRETLIDLFDRELVESQEELGMSVVGQFRDEDDPDRFVWLRGFADMETRLTGLAGFYGGPVWADHRDVANATMVDSDDVLLLRPAHPDGGLRSSRGPRPPVGAGDTPRSLVTATMCPLSEPSGQELRDLVTSSVEPLLVDAGAGRLATLETETAPNTFPALPVREGEQVLVLLDRFDSVDDHATHVEELRRSAAWGHVERRLLDHLAGPPQRLRLRPTARSLLR